MRAGIFALLGAAVLALLCLLASLVSGGARAAVLGGAARKGPARRLHARSEAPALSIAWGEPHLCYPRAVITECLEAVRGPKGITANGFGPADAAECERLA